MEKEIKKSASQMRKEFFEASRPSNELRGRMWLLLKTGVKGGIKGEVKVESYGWFAKEKLGIKPSSLSRKLTGKDRFFNSYDIEIFKEHFGEDAMDVENFDLVNGRLIAKVKEDLQD